MPAAVGDAIAGVGVAWEGKSHLQAREEEQSHGRVRQQRMEGIRSMLEPDITKQVQLDMKELRLCQDTCLKCCTSSPKPHEMR